MTDTSTNASPKLKRWQRLAIALLTLGTGLAALCVWFLRVPGGGEAMFRGKPEAEWIKDLRYNTVDNKQTEEWRSFGEEGVQVLIRGLKRAQRPGERTYRRFYRSLPIFVARRLKYPKQDSTRGTRVLICALIADLGKDARSAVPVMARSLRDEDANVRHFALTFFGWRPDGDAVLSLMSPQERRKVLPDLMRVTQESPYNRINGLSALKYFPEEKEVVTPFLLVCLHDTNSLIRIPAAEALRRVDPEAAKSAGALAILIRIATDPGDIRASQAVWALPKFSHDTDMIVPVLISCLEATNATTACCAVWILEWPKDFGKYADTVVPALAKAAQRTDSVRGYAKAGLTRYQSEGYAPSQ